MDIAWLIQSYGYLAVAAGAFLEGETVLITAGAIAFHGYLSPSAIKKWVMKGNHPAGKCVGCCVLTRFKARISGQKQAVASQCSHSINDR